MARYPTLTTARTWRNGNGLFHNNCRHSLSIYISGITDKPSKRTQSEINKDRELYRARQEYNRINSNIRRWRRRREVSIPQRDRQRANARLKELYSARREIERKYGKL